MQSIKMSTAVLLLLVVLLSPGAQAIGEGMLDVNTFAGVLGGLGKMFQGVSSKDVNATRLMGRWHQMYKAAINFDVFRTQMFCPVAYFTENSIMGKGGFTMEEAYRVISKVGPIETYKRDVTRYGPGSYWMYTEEYFYPRQLVMIDFGPKSAAEQAAETNATTTASGGSGEGNDTLADDVAGEEVGPYEYFVATDSNRLALMVFARDPVQFYQQYNKLVLAKLKRQGFGGSAFWNAPTPIYQGADCEWPTQREVFARRVLKNRQSPQSSPGIGTGLLGGFNPQAAVATVQGFLGRPAGQQQQQQQFAGQSQSQSFGGVQQQQRQVFQAAQQPRVWQGGNTINRS